MMNGFIIFGVTPRATKNMDFLRRFSLDQMVQAFCTLDRNLNHSTFQGKPVLLWDEAAKLNLPFFLAVEPSAHSVATWLLESFGSYYSENLVCLLSTKFGFDATSLSRQYCSFIHDCRMDTYYEDNGIGMSAEEVEKYINQAGRITLVDMLENNIDFCKERFSDRNNISYYKNNGFSLADLKDSSYSALFTYDSMVHFEMPDIYRYLKETRRILRSGGRGLFHHSNLMIDPKQSFYNPLNNGARTYMSKDLFAHLAYQVGLTVVEQQVIDWTIPKMDCITLVEKE